MSRTYRRKNTEKPWLWYKTEEEFNIDKKAFADEDYEGLFDNQPKRPDIQLYRLDPWMDGYSELKTEWETFRAFFRTPRYLNYRRACDFKHRSHGADSYKEYLRIEKVIYHSDAGFGYKADVPAWFNNVFFERPMRRSVKRALKKAYKFDEFDCTVYDEQINGSAWYYY